MARRGDGNGGRTPPDLTVRILRQLRDEIKGLRADTNARFEAMDRRFESMEGSLVSLERATVRGFEAVTARLENLRDIAGARWRDHEKRIRVLERARAR